MKPQELPKVKVHCACWKLEGSGPSTRWTGRDVDAEVLTVHIEKNKMRVRYVDSDGKPKTMDVDAQPFFARYNIVEK